MVLAFVAGVLVGVFVPAVGRWVRKQKADAESHLPK